MPSYKKDGLVERELRKYNIAIQQLDNRLHEFRFEIGEDFFSIFQQNLVKKGQVDSLIEINMHETFMDIKVRLQGVVELICDRSLENFNFPIKLEKEVFFKFGPEPKELSDEVFVITKDTPSINLAQIFYEFIALSIPIKKLHPKFQSTQDESETYLVYSSEKDDNFTETEKENFDPRWEELKKLKKQK